MGWDLVPTAASRAGPGAAATPSGSSHNPRAGAWHHSARVSPLLRPGKQEALWVLSGTPAPGACVATAEPALGSPQPHMFLAPQVANSAVCLSLMLPGLRSKCWGKGCYILDSFKLHHPPHPMPIIIIDHRECVIRPLFLSQDPCGGWLRSPPMYLGPWGPQEPQPGVAVHVSVWPQSRSEGQPSCPPDHGGCSWAPTTHIRAQQKPLAG